MPDALLCAAGSAWGSQALMRGRNASCSSSWRPSSPSVSVTLCWQHAGQPSSCENVRMAWEAVQLHLLDKHTARGCSTMAVMAYSIRPTVTCASCLPAGLQMLHWPSNTSWPCIACCDQHLQSGAKLTAAAVLHPSWSTCWLSVPKCYRHASHSTERSWQHISVRCPPHHLHSCCQLLEALQGASKQHAESAAFVSCCGSITWSCSGISEALRDHTPCCVAGPQAWQHAEQLQSGCSRSDDPATVEARN